ncbi:MAG: hypothetical protein KC620_13380 [Myxococcales bacterium]|nr:hypothetical protein [Myxococcales bacterium]
MTLDVLVLADEAHHPFRDELEAVLTRKGLTVTRALDDREARAVVACGACDPAQIMAALDRGAVVLPVGPADSWLAEAPLPVLARRVADAIDALLLLGRPERRTSDETIARACDEIDAQCADAGLPPLTRLCETITLAIHWGAPMYNAGGVDGCRRIYQHTAEQLLTTMGEAEDDDEAALLEALADELADALESVPDQPDIDAAAWTLRHAFDRILVARQTAEALHALEGLFDDLTRAGRGLSASLIYDVINLAVTHGAPLYNAGSAVGCAQVYLCTAAGLLRLLAEPGPDDGRTEQTARETLPKLVERGEEQLREDADALAWGLRRAFDALAEIAAEERRWEHDS